MDVRKGSLVLSPRNNLYLVTDRTDHISVFITYANTNDSSDYCHRTRHTWFRSFPADWTLLAY